MVNRYTCYFALLLALTGIASVASEERIFFHNLHLKTLTLEQAIALAFRERPSISKFNFDIASAHDTAKAALAGYLPQITYHAGTGRASLDFFSPKNDMELNISQLLYSFAGPMQQYQIDEEEVFALQAQQTAEQNKSRYEVETSLIDLWNIRQKEFVIKQYDLSSHETWRRDKHQENLGLLDLVDWMQATATFEVAQAIVKEFKYNVMIAQSAAERSVGIGPWNEIMLDNGSLETFIEHAIADAPHYDSGSCFKDALAYRPELLANIHEIQKALYQERFYQRSYFPKIGLFFEFVLYTYQQSCCTQPDLCNPGGNLLGTLNKFRAWRLGFSFDWSFDGLANTFNATASRQHSCAMTMQRFDIIDQIKKEVETSHSSLTIALKDLHAAKATYEQAKTQYEAQKIKHDIGLISIIEFENAKLLWDKAQTDYTDSKVAVAKKRSDLLLACGYPKKGKLNL